LLIIPLSTAITLDTGTVLNTTVSNSSMTFSIPINVTNFTIQTVNITLEGVVCSTGNATSSTIFWNTPNANNDSAQYCIIPPTPPETVSSQSFALNRVGYNLIVIFSALALLAVVIAMLFPSTREKITNFFDFS